MKKIFMLFSCLITITTCAFADEPAPCSRLVGSWYGSFTLKDPRECHIYRGCQHSMLGTVKHLGGNKFLAEVHPHVGREGAYELTCVKGTVTSKDQPGVFMFTCLDRTICQMRYDDDRLAANALSAGV